MQGVMPRLMAEKDIHELFKMCTHFFKNFKIHVFLHTYFQSAAN